MVLLFLLVRGEFLPGRSWLEVLLVRVEVGLLLRGSISGPFNFGFHFLS